MGDLSAFRLASTQKAIDDAPKPPTDAQLTGMFVAARSALDALDALVAVAKSTELPEDDDGR